MTGETAASLRSLAHHCRRLALGAGTPEEAASLNEMAEDYERRATDAEEASALGARDATLEPR